MFFMCLLIQINNTTAGTIVFCKKIRYNDFSSVHMKKGIDMTENYELLRRGLETAFVDCNTASNVAYKPQFVSNDYNEYIVKE